MIPQKGFSTKTFIRMQRQRITGSLIAHDTWNVPSATRAGVNYTVRVELVREIESASTVAASLHATCTCPSRLPCKHRLWVVHQYNNDFLLLKHLLGVPVNARVSTLERAIRAALEGTERRAA